MGTAFERQGGSAAKLGFELPPQWWPSDEALNEIEDAGFRWLQVSAPPAEMLADPRHSVCHAKALAQALKCRQLSTVVRSPAGLRLGTSIGDRAFEGLLEYTAQLGAGCIVYRALDFPRRGRDSAAEELSLGRLATWAEALGLAVLLENLCPIRPGASHVCHDPLSIRDLIARIGSPQVGMLFDVGHANVVADLMGVELVALIEPVLSCVQMLQLHDNHGGRLGHKETQDLDPLRLDLHLPPGAGGVDWHRVGMAIREVDVPLIVEVDPSLRLSAAAIHAAALKALAPPVGVSLHHLVRAA